MGACPPITVGQFLSRPHWCSLGFPYSVPGPRWGLRSPRPLVCPPLVNSWLRPEHSHVENIAPKCSTTIYTSTETSVRHLDWHHPYYIYTSLFCHRDSENKPNNKTKIRTKTTTQKNNSSNNS